MVVWNWHSCLRWAFGSVANQVCESMRILDWSWNLNRSSYVIVGIAQFVSQRLDLGRVSSCRIVYYYIVCWAYHSLSGNLTDQEEIISIIRNNLRVDYGSWLRIH